MELSRAYSEVGLLWLRPRKKHILKFAAPPTTRTFITITYKSAVDAVGVYYTKDGGYSITVTIAGENYVVSDGGVYRIQGLFHTHSTLINSMVVRTMSCQPYYL